MEVLVFIIFKNNLTVYRIISYWYTMIIKKG